MNTAIPKLSTHLPYLIVIRQTIITSTRSLFGTNVRKPLPPAVVYRDSYSVSVVTIHKGILLMMTVTWNDDESEVSELEESYKLFWCETFTLWLLVAGTLVA